MDEISGRSSRLTFGGLATGLDTGAIIEALLDAEQRPISALENRKSNLESQKSAVQELSNAVLAVRQAAGRIDNRSSLFSGASFNEEFLAYSATSGNEDLLEVEVTGSAAPGNFEIEIDQLATVSRHITPAFADPNAVLANVGDALLIDYGGAENIFVTPGAGETFSLLQLRDEINDPANGNDGTVKATLLDDGTGTRLIISGTKTGAANDFTVFTNLTGPGGVPFVETANPALDAKLTYLGVSVTRDSNDIADLVPGTSLRLRGLTTSTPVGVTVSPRRRDHRSRHPRARRQLQHGPEVPERSGRDQSGDEPWRHPARRFPAATRPAASARAVDPELRSRFRYDREDRTRGATRRHAHLRRGEAPSLARRR